MAHRKLYILSILSILFINSFISIPAFATNQPYPSPILDVNHSGTATGSAVTVLQDGSSQSATYRNNCMLQNNGTHNMYYIFGGGTATTGSKVLPAGAIMYCSDGVYVSSQALSLLGTSGDSYALTESFLRGN